MFAGTPIAMSYPEIFGLVAPLLEFSAETETRRRFDVASFRLSTPLIRAE